MDVFSSSESSPKKKIMDIVSFCVSESSSTKVAKPYNSPDWAGLPGDIVLDIADKLMSCDIEDFVRIAAVCTSWRTILLQNKKQKVCSLCSPLLVIAVVRNYQAQSAVYSPGKNKVYQDMRRLNVPSNRICCCSSFGWLINMKPKHTSRGRIITEYTSSGHIITNFDVYLHNPFINKVIRLPPLGHVENVRSIYKAALSNNPSSSSSEFIVISIKSIGDELAFFKSGTETWISIDDNRERPGRRLFQDVIFYHKTKQFYASDSSGEVFAIDFAGDGNPKLVPAAVALPIADSIDSKVNLIEDMSSGDLYQFYLEDTNQFYLEDTIEYLGFVVFKFDSTEEKWIRTHDIGDKIIFFSWNGSFLRSVSNCPGCQPNSIYFFTNTSAIDITDVGIYNLKDGSVRPLSTIVSLRYSLASAVWLEPTLL